MDIICAITLSKMGPISSVSQVIHERDDEMMSIISRYIHA